MSDNVDWEVNLRRLQRHHTSKQHERELIYNVTLSLADAADFGVPQRRHRVFFVGFRQDLNVGWSFPIRTHTHEDLLRSKYITGEYWTQHGFERLPKFSLGRESRKVELLRSGELLSVTKRWNTVRDALRGLPEPSEGNPIPNHRLQTGARSYPGHTGSLLDEPSKALKAGDHGVPGGENMLRYPDGRVRYFSVRESARIQTFPDSYVFPGSWTESMRQLGNAVPVELARVVAYSVAVKIASATMGVRAGGAIATPGRRLR